jgi:hypothetical protein
MTDSLSGKNAEAGMKEKRRYLRDIRGYESTLAHRLSVLESQRSSAEAERLDSIELEYKDLKKQLEVVREMMGRQSVEEEIEAVANPTPPRGVQNASKRVPRKKSDAAMNRGGIRHVAQEYSEMEATLAILSDEDRPKWAAKLKGTTDPTKRAALIRYLKMRFPEQQPGQAQGSLEQTTTQSLDEIARREMDRRLGTLMDEIASARSNLGVVTDLTTGHQAATCSMGATDSISMGTTGSADGTNGMLQHSQRQALGKGLVETDAELRSVIAWLLHWADLQRKKHGVTGGGPTEGATEYVKGFEAEGEEATTAWAALQGLGLGTVQQQQAEEVRCQKCERCGEGVRVAGKESMVRASESMVRSEARSRARGRITSKKGTVERLMKTKAAGGGGGGSSSKDSSSSTGRGKPTVRGGAGKVSLGKSRGTLMARASAGRCRCSATGIAVESSSSSTCRSKTKNNTKSNGNKHGGNSSRSSSSRSSSSRSSSSRRRNKTSSSGGGGGGGGGSGSSSSSSSSGRSSSEIIENEVTDKVHQQGQREDKVHQQGPQREDKVHQQGQREEPHGRDRVEVIEGHHSAPLAGAAALMTAKASSLDDVAAERYLAQLEGSLGLMAAPTSVPKRQATGDARDSGGYAPLVLPPNVLGKWPQLMSIPVPRAPLLLSSVKTGSMTTHELEHENELLMELLRAQTA